MRGYCHTPYKAVYQSKGEALYVLERQRKSRRMGKQKWEPVVPYRCSCGGYHLTGKRWGAMSW